MSSPAVKFFLLFLIQPVMVESFKLSGETGLGICLGTYIAVDAVQISTIDLNEMVQRLIGVATKAWMKLSGLNAELAFEMPRGIKA